MYTYPDNLKVVSTLWLLQLRDITLGGLISVIGAALWAQFGSYFVAAMVALYLFLTICLEDTCVLDFIRKACVFFYSNHSCTTGY